MRKLIEKVTSALTAFLLVGSNLIPAIVYAANEIPDLSTDEKVLFDANINDNASYTANIDEQLSLNINLSVVGDGYIKEGTIKIEGNNYKLGDIEENNNVEKVDDNTFELSQITDKSSVNLSVPIEFERKEETDIDYFEKDSSVKLDATYINENGEEENVSKEINNHLKWDTEVEGNISQELRRYLKYENKTLISFLVSSGIKDNKIPITEKTIQILAPLVNGIEPSKVIVSGDNISYDYQNQVVVISKDYVTENKVQWNSDDEYLVTYIYDTQVEETDIETLAVMIVKTASKNNIEMRTENFSYHVKDNVGNLLETSIGGDSAINKGYMYTNLNRTENKLETPYNSVYQINIGLADFIDEIEIREFPSKYETIDKSISIDRENLIEILGEEGTIRVLDQKNVELGVLNKDNLQVEANQFGLKFYTSNPIKEGNLNIFINKAINPNLIYTKENLSNTSYIENVIDVFGRLQGQEISYSNVVKYIELVEPQSNATITVSKENLSTVIKNENVVITATLEKNDISDMLYKDPEILITLPDKISTVELKDAKLIYEDELIPVIFRAEGNAIYLKLEGVQTEYSSLPNANGTVVRIVMDLTLDSLAVNSEEKIIFQYTNGAVGNEINKQEIPVKIIAPAGFITANYGETTEKITSISEDKVIRIKANDKEKQINLSGAVVNNLSESASGFMILGRIPSQDTRKTDVSNESLNSTFTTNLASAISVEGVDADVYYSDNGNATYDLNNGENGWSLEAKDTNKSYLIVPKSEIAPAQKITFNYNVNIPRNIDYENNAVSEYAVYYDNYAENGTSKNIIVSKAITIATENIPVIKTEITAIDYNTEEKIENGSEVNLGRFIKYTVHITNTGKESAEGVILKVFRPENSPFYIIRYLEEGNIYDNYYDYSEELSQAVGTIEPGETKEIEFIVDTSVEEQDSVITSRAQVIANNIEDDSTASFENKVTKGTLELKISSMLSKDEVKIGDKITYYITAENHGEIIENTTVNIEIPKYIKLEEYNGGNYNEETRVLSYEIKNLSYEKFFVMRAEIESSDEPNQEIALVAKAIVDEKEIKSNRYVKTVMDGKGIIGTLSSNIEGKMLDTDTVEYYINVKNESKKTVDVDVYDYLPAELNLKSYTVKNGNKGYTVEDVKIIQGISEKLEVGESLKVTIVAKPYMLDSVGQIKEIENSAHIVANGKTINLNSIKQQIEGTSNFNTAINEDTKEEKENIYSIAGKVWYDENKNSKKDENETGIKGISLKLYDVNAKTYLKDENGKTLEVYSNENGDYKFENLVNGQYIVMASYDNESYTVSNYLEENLSQNENNDFIESKIKEATTNIINVNGENVYNTDLGLIDVDNFNIVLDNKISKISVIDGKETKVYDINSENANVKIKNKENATVILEYKIDVINQGNIDGYVTKVINPIPKKMRFVSELNNDWYIDKDGNAVNTSIANTLIKAGEKITITIVLLQDLNEENKEILNSVADIKETYNKYGVEEVKKKSLLATKGKSAQILIVKNNTSEVLQVLGISIGIVATIALFGVVLYKVINKEKITK